MHGGAVHCHQPPRGSTYASSVSVCRWYEQVKRKFDCATHTRSAAQLLAIRSLDHVMNSIALIFVLSAASTDLYISSRTLYGLALEGKAPVFFKRVNRFGVPYAALGASVVVACSAFLSIGQGPGKVLEYLSNLSSTFGALAWSKLCSTLHQTPKLDIKPILKCASHILISVS
jgi:L-asparagine transporter-like permease